MNSIIRWSQNIKISAPLFIVISVLLFFQTQTFAHQQAIYIYIFVASTFFAVLVTWGLSKAMKFQNANISSALFISGVGAFYSLLSNFLSLSTFVNSAVLVIVPFFIIIVLSKNIYKEGLGRIVWFSFLSGVIPLIFIVLGSRVFSLEKRNEFLETFIHEKQSIQEKIPER